MPLLLTFCLQGELDLSLAIDFNDPAGLQLPNEHPSIRERLAAEHLAAAVVGEDRLMRWRNFHHAMTLRAGEGATEVIAVRQRPHVKRGGERVLPYHLLCFIEAQQLIQPAVHADKGVVDLKKSFQLTKKNYSINMSVLLKLP